MSSSQDFLPDRRIDRRKFALGLVFASTVLVAAWRQPSKKVDYLGRTKLEAAIPKTLGPWQFMSSSGLVVPPEDQLSALLYSQLLTRVYVDGESEPIMLLIAQSAQQTGVLQVHRPEFCYPAGGYTLSPIGQHPIKVNNGALIANSLTATTNGLQEQILYWTRIGDHMPVSWTEQRLAVASDNLRGLIPDAVMVRVSMVNNDRKAALPQMERFIRLLLEEVSDPVRKALIA